MSSPPSPSAAPSDGMNRVATIAGRPAGEVSAVTVGFAKAVLPPCDDREELGDARLEIAQVHPPTAEVVLGVLDLVHRVPGVAEDERVAIADVALHRMALDAGRGGQCVVGSRVGLGAPEAEVDQGSAGLPVDIAIPVIVEADLDDRMVDV